MYRLWTALTTDSAAACLYSDLCTYVWTSFSLYRIQSVKTVYCHTLSPSRAIGSPGYTAPLTVRTGQRWIQPTRRRCALLCGLRAGGSFSRRRFCTQSAARWVGCPPRLVVCLSSLGSWWLSLLPLRPNSVKLQLRVQIQLRVQHQLRVQLQRYCLLRWRMWSHYISPTPRSFLGNLGTVGPSSCNVDFILSCRHRHFRRNAPGWRTWSHTSPAERRSGRLPSGRETRPSAPRCSYSRRPYARFFDHTARGREAARALMDLRQGNRRVSTYAVEFRTLATESGWNEEALFDAFMRGLAESIRDHLTALELPNDVDSLIALVIKIDNHIQLREEERSRLHVNAPSRRDPATDPRLLSWRSPARFSPVAASPAPPANSEEPMQLGRTRLTAEERQRRLREGRCIYCGQTGHFISGCPLKSQTFVRNALVSHSTFSSLRPVIQAQLITFSQTVNHPVLVDSGADESFMDWRLAKRLDLELISLPKPLEAHALDGRLLCRVTHRTRPIQFTISKDHTEALSFHLLNSPSHPLILGFPWLSKHNPHMDWSTGKILGWDVGWDVPLLVSDSLRFRAALLPRLGQHRWTQTFRISPGFLRATSISRRCSIRPGPPLYPLTDLMTVLLICYQALHPLGGASIPCLRQR